MLSKPSLIVVCDASRYPRMAPHINALKGDVFNRIHVGTDISDFPPTLRRELSTGPLVVLGGSTGTRSVIAELLKEEATAAQFKWLHSYFVGVDGIQLGTIPGMERIPITNARGASSQLLAEHVLLSILYFNRSVVARQVNKKNRAWKFVESATAESRTLGILGYGDIGQAVAKAAHGGLGMKVLGWKQRPIADTVDDLGTTIVTGEAGLDELLLKSDVVVNALPLTPFTTDFINAKFLSKMRQGSIFVNVGRGNSVVEADLIHTLAINHLRGAAIDVCRREPMAPEDPLWDVPDDKLLITAHDAAQDVETPMAQFAKYAKRFALDGVLPKYRVDISRGY